jgi:hypothetical protein
MAAQMNFANSPTYLNRQAKLAQGGNGSPYETSRVMTGETALKIHMIVTRRSSKKIPAIAHQLSFDESNLRPCQLHCAFPMDMVFCIGCEEVVKFGSEHFRVNCHGFRGWTMLAERLRRAQILGYIDPTITFQVNADTIPLLVNAGVTFQRVLKQGDNWYPDEVLYDFNAEGNWVSTTVIPINVIVAMPHNIRIPKPVFLNHGAVMQIRDPLLDTTPIWAVTHAAIDDRKVALKAEAYNEYFREINNWKNELYTEREALWTMYSKFKNMNGRLAQMEQTGTNDEAAVAGIMRGILHNFFGDVTPTGLLAVHLGHGPGNAATINNIEETDAHTIANNVVQIVPVNGNVDSVESKGTLALQALQQAIQNHLPPQEQRL